MKARKTPLIENGIVVGTGSDKYETKNPLAQYMLKTFDDAVAELASSVNPDTILEVGCGEGHITQILLDHTQAKIHATDLSPTIVNIARENLDSSRLTFEATNIVDLEPQSHNAELVVCCEVLEHLDNPDKGLSKLAQLAQPYALMSVPREPLWRILNFLRGAHVKSWGNSPGHIQHWSKKAFLDFVGREFELVEIRSPLPWTIILGRSKHYRS